MTIIQLPRLRSFHAVLSRLASPAQEQARYITELGSADQLDELALEFEDFYGSLKTSLGSLPNGRELASACEAIDLAFKSKSLGWSFDDMNSEEWEHIRALADHARELVGSSINEMKQ